MEPRMTRLELDRGSFSLEHLSGQDDDAPLQSLPVG